MAGRKWNSRPIIMFDICKIYPIWIPPYKDHTKESLIISVKKIGTAVEKASISFEEASKALQKAASCSGKRDDCPLVEIPSLKEVNDE